MQLSRGQEQRVDLLVAIREPLQELWPLLRWLVLPIMEIASIRSNLAPASILILEVLVMVA
jgi:hypothetical protein